MPCCGQSSAGAESPFRCLLPTAQLGNLLLAAILSDSLDALVVEGVPNLGTDASVLTPELLFPPGQPGFRVFFAPRKVTGSRISPSGDKAGE